MNKLITTKSSVFKAQPLYNIFFVDIVKPTIENRSGIKRSDVGVALDDTSYSLIQRFLIFYFDSSINHEMLRGGMITDEFDENSYNFYTYETFKKLLIDIKTTANLLTDDGIPYDSGFFKDIPKDEAIDFYFEFSNY